VTNKSLLLSLIDASEKLEDIKIKYNSCWNVLDELKVDKSRVFTILTKCDDGVIGLSDLIENIGNDLDLFNPIALSAKTGYGIYTLKTMIGRKLYSQYRSERHHSTEVTRAQEADTSIIAAADIHT